MNETTYKPHPLRIQRKRTKGWKMPPGAVYVGRPTIWGNPFDSADAFRELLEAVIGMPGEFAFHNVTNEQVAHVTRIARCAHALRGRLLACWCPLDRPCHGDFVAELANLGQETTR